MKGLQYVCYVLVCACVCACAHSNSWSGVRVKGEPYAAPHQLSWGGPLSRTHTGRHTLVEHLLYLSDTSGQHTEICSPVARTERPVSAAVSSEPSGWLSPAHQPVTWRADLINDIINYGYVFYFLLFAINVAIKSQTQSQNLQHE